MLVKGGAQGTMCRSAFEHALHGWIAFFKSFKMTPSTSNSDTSSQSYTWRSLADLGDHAPQMHSEHTHEAMKV